MSRVLPYLLLSGLLLLGCWLVTPPVCGQDGSSPDAAQPTEKMATLRIKITDKQGEPVAAATVIASGVRCEESPGSWISWPVKSAGPNNRFTTDATGNVEIPYPVQFGLPPYQATTTVVTLVIQHAEFIAARTEVDVPAVEVHEQELTPGCEVSFSAIDDQQQVVDKFGVFISSVGYDAQWIQEGRSMRSRAVPDGKWQTMLVAPQSDGRTLFSGVLPARYVSGGDFTIKNAKLSPGLSVHGRLADDVPRPITDGIVVSWSQPKPTPQELENHEAIGWSDSAIINPDGTFHFESLPRGGRLQLLAVCRGWVITDQPRPGQVQPHSQKIGVLLDLDSQPILDNRLNDVVLPMDPAGTLEVTVKKPDGSPLAGATISTWPNQTLEDQGSNVLGSVYPSMHVIRAQLDPNYQRPDPWRDRNYMRYERITDAEGKATLYDVPLNRPHQLSLVHDDYHIAGKRDVWEAKTFTLDSPEPVELEVSVVPRPQ